MDNLILAMLTNEISKELVGSRVVNVTGLAPTSFAIQLRKKEHDVSSLLLICLDPHLPALFSVKTPISELALGTPAGTLPEGFLRSMSDILRGTTLNGLLQHDADRVAEIEFSGEEGRRFLKLWLELFGRRPSAVLVRSDGNIIEACSREGTTSSAGILLWPGEKYAPPSQGSKLDVGALSLDLLRKLLEGTSLGGSHEELDLTLSRRLKGLSPQAAKEIVEHASSGGHVTIEDLFQGLKEAVAEPDKHFRPAVRIAAQEPMGPPALLSVYVRTEQGVTETGVETHDAEIGSVTTYAEPSREDATHVLRCFLTASEATRFSFFELCHWYTTLSAARLRRHAAVLSRKLAKLRGLLLEDLFSAERAHDFRIAGELILANMKCIKRGSTSVELRDIHADGQSLVRVNLDPSQSPADNAERYFKKARKAERAHALLKRRLTFLERSLIAVDRFSESIPEEVDTKEAERLSQELEGLAGRVRVPTSTGLGREKDGILPVRPAQAPARHTQTERAARPMSARTTPGPKTEARTGARFSPRVFETSDGFTVLVGRNNKENDYLTHHLAKPEDLWFHASGMPGSHVILKRKGKSAPSRKAIEEAASVAAYFSKGRTSSGVPVIYTEKKYVHKPRGSRPGTATCAREKFLMVTPQKPVSASF